MKLLLKVFLAFLIIGTAITALATDVVRMKNGDVYRGEIVQREMNDFIQLRLKDGNEKRLTWNDIEGVTKENKLTPPIVPTDAISDGRGAITTG